MDDITQSAETAIRLRSQLGGHAVVYVRSCVEEAQQASEDPQLTYWRDVALYMLMMEIPPPSIHPDDLLSCQAEFGQLALALLRDMAVSHPELAERMAAAGIGIEG